MKSTSWLKIYTAKFVLCCTILFTGLSAAAQLNARFSGTALSGCAPILVHFTDESTGNPNYWKWDLGDGTVSYLQHPSVTYFTPGSYTVKLLIKSVSGEDSLVKTNYVQVYAPPAVNFSASQTNSCGSLTVNFVNESSSGNAWLWDIGDGVFSTSENPGHTYTHTGSYNVSLKVINSDGCAATLLKHAYININNVKADFATLVSERCKPTKISFKNSSYGNGRLQYKWLFGNGDSSIVHEPLYQYAAAGNYTVKLLVSNELGCIDSVSKNISVEAPVSASFSADITNACKAPAQVYFTSQVLNNNLYYWTFGDSTTAVVSNPLHVFADTGKYSIKLVIKNTNGCTDSLVKSNYISIQKPFASLENLPDSGCAPLNKTLSFIDKGSDSIVSYVWNFDNAATSTALSPNYHFTGMGYHTVSLITTGLSGCRDTTVMQNAIKVSSKPIADFSATIRNACAQTPIQFTNQSGGGATEWIWEFGDNNQSADQHPEHKFTDTGFLMVRLIALNGGCADTLTKQRYVYIKPAVAKFKADFGCANPFSFSFSNFSIGAESWTWDFGDGSRSTALNPMHLYSDTGTYSVSLTVNNLTTGCGYYKSKEIKVVKLHPDFFVSDSVLCKNRTVRFTSTVASAEASRFTWDFGDGTIESARDNYIEHTYEAPGNYSVKLITINLVNCRDTVVKTNYINVNGLKADFGTGVSMICANNSVVFTDSSTTSGSNSIQSWQWNYGDGHVETSYAAPFVHTYTGRGNFAVSLKVTDNKGCTDVHVADLAVTVKKVSALFGVTDTVKCTQDALRFVCPYSEPGVSYSWDFGDGNSATQQSVLHSFGSEGIYTVKLNVKQGGCEDSSIRVNYIKVENPVAKFSMSDSFRTCPPLIIQFTSQSVNGADEIWDFGDGSTTNTHNPSHFYSYPGVYTATLTVNGRGGCSSKMQKQIVVKGPKGSLSYTPLNFCKPGDAGFTAHTTDAVSYVWDFNDGATVINSDSVISHRYNNPGKYIPRLMLTDNQGCKVPVMGRDTINIVQLESRFEFANNTVCSQEHVAFVNTTSASENIVSYQWNFGDGFNAGNTDEPTHDYQAAGLYYPLLVVTTASGCTDSFTTAVPVKVAALPNATIQSVASGCTPLTAAFTASANTSSVPIVSWEWDFGNGNSALQQNPATQLYGNAGNYNITLKVTSDEGCEQLISKAIDAYPLPQLQFAGNTEICKGSGTTITVSGANSLVWDAASSLHCTNCSSTLATPLATTSYTVTGSNNFGCTAKDTVTVKVIQPFTMQHPANTALCAGKSAVLQAAGADIYEWSPAAGLNDVHVTSPVAQPASTTMYTVIGKDNNGCFTDTAFVTVTVNPVPLVDAGIDKSIASGASLELVPVVSADVTQLRWSPTDGVFRNSGNAITIKPTASTEYTVEVKNAAGCAATDKVTVTVTVNTAGNVFIPNTFSPNGDGSNDIFYPRAASSVRINKFKIVNREGVTVFEKNNFFTNDAASGWDGTLRGMKMPSDVYIYVTQIIDGNGKPYLLSGNVSLLR